MRNRGKWLVFLLILAACAGFGVYQYLYIRGTDRVPPQIVMAQNELELSVSDPEDALLAGVTATDAHDGDVTSSLLVESVRGIVADQRFTVTYAAFDAAGNVAKAQRIVRYTDYTSPRYSLSAPLIFRAGSTPDVFSVLGAEDVLDGDLSDRIKGTLVSGESSLLDAGEYTVEFRVTNLLGDTAYLTAPVLLTEPESGAAQLTLSRYLVYLKTNERFTPERYLQTLEAGGQSIRMDAGSDTVEIESNVNTAVPGTYYVDYTAEFGRYTGRTRLLVVVED